jgi:hypothetical protein
MDDKKAAMRNAFETKHDYFPAMAGQPLLRSLKTQGSRDMLRSKD